MLSFVSLSSHWSGHELVIFLKGFVLLICKVGRVVLLGWHFVSCEGIKGHTEYPTSYGPQPSDTSATGWPGLCPHLDSAGWWEHLGWRVALKSVMQNRLGGGGEVAPCLCVCLKPKAALLALGPFLTGLDRAVLILEQTHWSGIFP